MWTPEWARAIRFEAKRGRYDSAEVDSAFEQLVGSYEQVWNEREALREAVAAYEEEIRETRTLERGLRDAIVRGQRLADEIRNEAALERERMLEAAHEEVERLTADGQEEVQRLQREIARLKELRSEIRRSYEALLGTGLAVLEEFPVEDEAPQESGRLA